MAIVKVTMSTPTWENQMRLEVNRDAEPPDRDRDCCGGGGEDGGEPVAASPLNHKDIQLVVHLFCY